MEITTNSPRDHGIRHCAVCGALVNRWAAGTTCWRCMLALDVDPTELAKGPSGLAPAPSAGSGQGLARTLAPTTLPGERLRFGDYELEEPIAHGGMGIVYRARQISLGRTVAVKLLLLGRFSSAESIERFRREAQHAASLRHPNIVAIHEVGEYEGQHFFSMDYVEGQSLAARLKDGPLPPREAAEIARDIARAIDYAHRQGVLHRDIKPSNVLLDCFDQVRITDFGLAKKLDGSSDLTESGQMLGTPNYLSPEQAAGRNNEVGPASDIHSVGALLYELLTGRPPYLAQSLQETLNRIRDTEPVSPRALNPGLDRDLETICLKCLRKEPGRRYETALALAEDLERWLERRPILARPTPAAERAWLWCRRRPRQAALLGMTSLAVLAALVTLTVSTLSIRAARTVAEQKAKESRHSLIRRYVAEGNRLMEDGLPFTALPWMVEALGLEGDDPQREADERLRIAQASVGAPELRLHLAQGKSVQCVALSPDGSRLATGSDDGIVRISEVASGGETGTNLFMPAMIRRVRFSPDGGRVLAVDKLGRACIWNATTGEMLTPLLQADDFDEKSVANVAKRLKPEANFSPDGRFVLLAWGSKSAQLRDATNGVLLREFAHKDVVYHAALSRDGQFVVTSSKDRTARVWEVATGKLAAPPLQHIGVVDWAQFNSDGGKLLTVRDTHYVQLWNWRDGQRLGREIPRRSNLSHASLSPDDKKVLTVAKSGNAHLYDTETTLIVNQFVHEGGLVDATFSPDGLHAAVACQDGNVWVWDVDDTKRRPMLLPAGNQIEQIAFSSNGRFLTAGTRGGHARVWELFPPERGVRRLPGNDVQWVEFDRSGRRALLLSTHKETGWSVYETQTGKLINSGKLGPRTKHVRLSPDGRRILALRNDPGVLIVDADSGQELPPLMHERKPQDAMWSPDGRFVVTAQGGSAHAWDSATGKLAMSFSHSNSVRAIAVSADGTHLATGHNDKTVQIWEMRTGRHEGALKAAEKIDDIRFSPDGRLVAISTFNSGTDGIVEVLDVASGKVVGRPLRHRDEVVSFEFSPDGRLLATACNDHTARVWDATTGEAVTPWLPHDFETRQVAFSPDGARLATLARRGAARLWNAHTGEPLTAPIVYERNEGSGGVSYSPDGLRLLISRGGNEAWLRELQPETATLEELRLRAEVLSCTRFDATAGMVPLDESSLNLAWKQLRALHARN